MFCRISFGNLCCHKLGKIQRIIWLARSRKHTLRELTHTRQVRVDPGLQFQKQMKKGRVMLEYPLMMFQKGEAVLSFEEKYRQCTDNISQFISINFIVNGNFPNIYNRMIASIVFIFFL